MPQPNELGHSTPEEMQKVSTADGDGEGNAIADPGTDTERGEEDSHAKARPGMGTERRRTNDGPARMPPEERRAKVSWAK